MTKQIPSLKEQFENENLDFFKEKKHILNSMNETILYSHILDLVEMSKNIEFLSYIFENQDRIDVSYYNNKFIRSAIIQNNIEVVKYLLNHDNFQYDSNYQEAFIAGCSIGNLDIIKYIIENKKINITDNTILFLLIRKDKYVIFDYLLKNVDFNVTENNHFLLLNTCKIKKFNFLNSLINHSKYLFLKPHLSNICLDKVKNEDFYLFNILYQIKEFQKSIDLYFINNWARRHDDFKKYLISNKIKSF
tara:strand:+ start:8105 stop:8848 length:744 start_codon:yes stop_codon:yes gene_type:complete